MSKEMRNPLEMLNVVAQAAAQAIQAERERNDAFTRATWATLSRRERPVYVNSLRESGFTQQEIASTVGMSQPSIALYEKKYKLQQEVSQAVRPSNNQED